MSRTDLRELLRRAAADLLVRGKVDAVIGFEEGSIPFSATPLIAVNGDDAGRLTWNSFCYNNLSVYLHRVPGRVGIVAKPCDTRAIVVLLKENQIKRENLFIIGVPCRGMVDPERLRDGNPRRMVTLVEDGDHELVLSVDSHPLRIQRESCLNSACRTCVFRTPVIHDMLIGNPVESGKTDGYHDVREFALLSPDDRWGRVTREMDRCIRCYACRNACPLCYCGECFADSSRPRWVGMGARENDSLLFHMVRSLHLAGRCVECGACRRACPMDIDLGILGRKVSEEVFRLFRHIPGLDQELPAPLSTFSADDPEEFMLDPSPSGER